MGHLKWKVNKRNQYLRTTGMDNLGIEGSPWLIPVIIAQSGYNLVFMKIC